MLLILILSIAVLSWIITIATERRARAVERQLREVHNRFQTHAARVDGRALCVSAAVTPEIDIPEVDPQVAVHIDPDTPLTEMAQPIRKRTFRFAYLQYEEVL